MNEVDAAVKFAALAHETRLKLFRALIVEGPQGMSAGRLAEALDVAPNNLSAHLNTLLQASLITVRKEGRNRFYAADTATIGDTVSFLIADCCKGHPEVCAPIRAVIGRPC